MCDKQSEFQLQGYVHLDEFLDLNNCRELTAELKRLVDLQQTTNDPQCPSSEAIHGNPTFDKLLADLLPHFETASGKRLLPTYSYARLYRRGEELKPHTDRPACEISATLTVGFEGNAWPIYMADYADTGDEVVTQQGESKSVVNVSEIKMAVGDAVLYRGMEKVHWRNVYTEGSWQAQIFLHYVDADGPHKEWIYDKRTSLSFVNEHEQLRYRAFTDVLTPEACDMLVRLYTKDEVAKQPPIIGTGTGTIDREIRNVERVLLPTYKDIGGRLAAVGLSANHHAWKFDITHANQAEFLIYPAGGRYQAHTDTMLSHSEECRKLTVLAFLNDDFEGGRFYLQDGHERFYPPQAKGTVLVFPSFILHGVEDVEQGQRCSVVCWMVGKFFK